MPSHTKNETQPTSFKSACSIYCTLSQLTFRDFKAPVNACFLVNTLGLLFNTFGTKVFFCQSMLIAKDLVEIGVFYTLQTIMYFKDI